MWTRISAGLVVLAAGLVSLAGRPATALAQSTTPGPKLLYGHDLKVRPGGEKDFPKAIKIGVEWFQYEVVEGEGPTRRTVPFTIGISESGWVSVYPAGPVGSDRNCRWLTAHDLSVRKAGEAEFNQKTKVWGVELFQDLGTNRLIYAAESGSIAFAPVPGNLVTEKGPKWHHALEPKVRDLEALTFENAKKIGLEVFKDENTSGLIYITETGAIATAAAPPSMPEVKKVVAPIPLYGLVLRIRGAGETEFTAATQKVGLEIFEDPNANTLLYLTTTGSVAVAPKPEKLADVSGKKAVSWIAAMNLGVRKAGERNFAKAKKYGVEVYQDNRTGNLIFISDTGAIAVLPK